MYISEHGDGNSPENAMQLPPMGSWYDSTNVFSYQMHALITNVLDTM